VINYTTLVITSSSVLPSHLSPRECVAPARQANLLNQIRILDESCPVLQGATHPPKQKVTVTFTHRVLREGDCHFGFWINDVCCFFIGLATFS